MLNFEGASAALTRVKHARMRTAVVIFLAAAAAAASLSLASTARSRADFSRHQPFLGTEPGEERGGGASPRPPRSALPALTSGEFRSKLRRLEGRPVVVNFWASWCGPCRLEAPELARLERAFSREGVSFLGINLKDDPSAVKRFIAEFGLRYPNFSDDAGLISGAYKVVAIPTTIVIDAAGNETYRSIGAIDGAKLRRVIRKTLHEQSRREVRPSKT